MAKHMLLVGGSRDIHPKVHALGFRTTFIFDIATLKNRKDMSKFSRLIALPIGAKEEWVETARLIHRIDPFECIGGFNEASQHLAAEIAQTLGLPYPSPATIRYTREKDAMRGKLREAGLDETVSQIATTKEEIAQFGADHGYPVVLKPVDGRGSLSVAIIRSRDDIAMAVERFQRFAPKYRMLLEQFLAGDEWSVESFSEKGKHRVVCVTQKFKDAVTCVETGHCLPAPMAEETRAAIEKLVVGTLDAIGLANGPSHTEVIVTPRGPRVVETHARLAGDRIVDLIRLGCGYDLDNAWIRQSGGESVLHEIPAKFEKFASVSYVTPNVIGTLERVDHVAAAEASPGVVEVELLEAPGTELFGAQNSDSRAASVIATGDTAAEASSRALAASGKLRFLVSCAG